MARFAVYSTLTLSPSLPRQSAFSWAGVTSGFASLLYTESYGMSVGALSIVTTVAKCIDFLIGFFVGHLSDSWQSRWGRRKPFVAVGTPVAAVMLVLLVNPPPALMGGAASSPTNTSALNSDVVGTDEFGSGGGQPAHPLGICEAVALQRDCDALQRCLAINIAHGELPHWSGVNLIESATASLPTGMVSASGWLSVWFLLTYGLKFCAGHTASWAAFEPTQLGCFCLPPISQ